MKGNIDIVLLGALNYKDMYGYELISYLRIRTNNKFQLKEGTVYVSLKRLENKGWVHSYWGEEQSQGGRRKYYNLTAIGKIEFIQKKNQWNEMVEIIDLCLKGVNE